MIPPPRSPIPPNDQVSSQWRTNHPRTEFAQTLKWDGTWAEMMLNFAIAFALFRTILRLHVSTPRDIECAPRNPMACWPAYAVMFPLANPRAPPKTSFIRSTFAGIPPLHTLARGSNGPAAAALEACGTTKVPACEIGNPPGRLSPIEVWKIPDRPAKTGRRHWRIGVRLGPVTGAEEANGMQTPPPALRRVGVREFLNVLPAPGQVG